MRIVAASIALLIALAGTARAQSPDEELFPRPTQLTDAVAFWTRIYTEVESDSGLIHDSRRLGVVYETIDVGTNSSSRDRRRARNRASEKYRAILSTLASGKRSGLTTDEARVLALWPEDTSNAEFRRATQRLRFQLGQADRFLAGLIRSGRWKPYIYEVLEAKGLPRELAALPHVESSFNPEAYSKVGAAGMWQFTRSTGVRYMRIDHIMDERRDPFLATDSATKLLQDNYSVIESWPLALTAYNHGLAGMRRAARRHETKDIGVIVENYSSRTFGFASRNFYAAFLAAVDVDNDPERFFGQVEIDSPEDLIVVEMPDYVDAAPLARALNISLAELRRLNPALTETVWDGDKFVPKGFDLRLPRSAVTAGTSAFAEVPASERYRQQRPDLHHRVRRGETLSTIAARYNVSVASLVRNNGLRNRNFIRVGQQLTLPVSDANAIPTLAASNDPIMATGGQYVVRRGDSIDKISRGLGIDPDLLLTANNIRNKNRIFPGQVLQVPSATAVAPATTMATAVLVEATPEEPVAKPSTEGMIVEERDVETIQLPEAAEAETAPITGEDPQPDLDSNALASAQASLAADPSDYTVDDNDTIEVQAMETLGHYADWLELPTQRLRELNDMPFRRAVVYGQRLALDFSSVDRKQFEQRRIAYQEQRQESFFLSFQIADIVDHVVTPGESLWLLAEREYKVPVWLLRQYNPDLNLDRVRPGTVVKFPQLQAIGGDIAQAPTGRELG